MSPDLRKALHDAAPQPTRELDLAALSRSGRRAKVFGVAAVSIMLGLGAATTWFVASELSDQPRPVPVGPDEEPLPSGIPTGPRFVVTSGTFDERRDWGGYEGQEWRIVTWSDRTTRCWSFEMGDEHSSDGVSCHEKWTPLKGVFGPRTFRPPGNFGNEWSISVGQVDPTVASLRFELSGDRVQIIMVEPVAVPPESGTDWRLRRYYVAFLPPAASGRIIAFDRGGKEIGRQGLCPGRCQGAYERELEGAQGDHTRVLFEYRGEPVLVDKNLSWGRCPVDPMPLSDVDVDIAAEVVVGSVHYLFDDPNEWRFREAVADSHRGPEGMFRPERSACGDSSVMTAVVNVEFPRWRDESASMGAATFYVSRTSDGWVIWGYTG